MPELAPPHRDEAEELRIRLAEAEETLRAIRSGEVDAIVVQGAQGHRIFTLEGSDSVYRVLVDQMNEGALKVNEHGVVVYANACFARMLGQPLEHIVGRRLVDFAMPGDAVPLARLLESQAARGEVQLRGADGPVPCLVSATALPEQPRALCVLATDLAETRRVEQERRLASARLDELERLKTLDAFRTQFLNAAAHELNTPMTPLFLQLDILRADRSAFSARQSRSLDIVHANVHRLAKLVGDLLTASRLDAGRLDVHRERVDLRALCQEACDAFAEAARQAGVQLDLDMPPEVDLHADPERLTQVLYNLLSNAVKFAPAGGSVRVTVRAEPQEVQVLVQDTGAGFPAGAEDALFRPFSQLHERPGGPTRGNGLGLYICKGIVEQHGGRIWAESPGPGLGATFGFALPRLPPSDGGKA